MGHGLLAVNVFAGGTGIFENSAMVVVGDGDDDGVDIFAVENLAVVAGAGDILVYGFATGIVP